VKYLLVATPIVSSGSLMNQRQVSAEAVQQDINNEEFCAAPQETTSDNNRKIIGFISTAVGVGLLMRLRSKRQQSERQDISVEVEALEMESALTATTDELAMARLDLALRTLSPSMIKLLRMVITSSDAVKAEFVEEVQVEGPWTQLSPRVIELSGSVELDTLVLLAHKNDAVPLLFPIGTTTVGEVWINLDVVGSFGVDAEDDLAKKVWNGLVQSLSLSPFAHAVSLVSEQSIDLPGRRVIIAQDNSHELMSALTSEESPSVLLLEKQPLQLDQPVIYRGKIPPGGAGLRCEGGEGDVIETWPIERWINTSQHSAIEKAIPPYTFVASVLGRPEVRHMCGKRVEFEKSKSEELVMWLAMHSSQQRRSSARAEMWHTPIKDATFSNITSDVRRSLTVAELPPEGEQWLGVTLTDELPLHLGIVSDVEILRACVDHARRWPEDGGVEVLRHGLGLVRGVPFETCLYIWCDSTGLATDAAVLVVRAAQMMAEMCTEIGDLDGVYWATAKGLLAVPGHEDLVAQRMRLHAERQDQAALRAEWQGYCRALANDDWGDASPSRKMVELWRDLTQTESYLGMTSGSI
jgi:hypothetical protein